MKKILVVFVTVLILLSGCSGKEPAQTALQVWSFTDELEGMIKNYYVPAHPGVNYVYTFTPSDQFEGRLDPVLSSGQGTPDVFALEAAFVRKYVESGQLLDLTDLYEVNKQKLLQYPVDIGSYNGRVYALSWQATPGAMFYRRSLAKKYLGTDDPATVQTYFADLNKFLETAGLLNERSNGSCVVVASGDGDLYNVFLSSRNDPWVVDGRLVIDPRLEQYMDVAKLLYERRWEGRVGQWSDGWFAGMRGELRDETKALEVFSYFLPTWGLHYVLKTNAPNTSGDWAMIPGPVPYYWGGTWLGAWKNTRHADVAKELIRYLTIDDGFLEQWARDTGDVVSNIAVLNKIKDNYSEPFLGGQNHYAEFAQMALGVNGRLVQGVNQSLDGTFREALNTFRFGEKTKAQALDDFRTTAETFLGLR